MTEAYCCIFELYGDIWIIWRRTVMFALELYGEKLQYFDEMEGMCFLECV